MKYENIIVEKKEYDHLKTIIATAHYKVDSTYKASLDKFLNELKNAKILNITKMPDDIVRFNSIVTIKDPYDNIRAYEIVKPEKSDLKANKISVLAPMGLALYGYAKDDEIMWQFPVGMQAIKILNVEQTPNFKNVPS
jgi:regulator of nucleoside diphosphate kinase